MNRGSLFIKIALVVSVTLPAQHAAAAGHCSQLFAAVGGAAKQYWIELKANPIRRFFLMPREEKEKFSWLWALDDPYAEFSSITSKYSKRFNLLPHEPLSVRASIPTVTILGAGGVMYSPLMQISATLDDLRLEKNIQFAAENQDKIAGAEYLLKLADAGYVDPFDFIETLNNHSRRLEQWAISGETLLRIKELRSLSIVKDGEEEKALNALALAAYRESPNSVPELMERFARDLQGHPVFGKWPLEKILLLQFVFFPKIDIPGEKGSDLALAKRAVENGSLSIAENADIVSAMQITKKAAEKR